MQDKKRLEELAREVLSGPPVIEPIGEIQGKEIFKTQKNTCGSYTTMTTDMSKFNKFLDNSITKVKKHNK